jgi:hypothetical protein
VVPPGRSGVERQTYTDALCVVNSRLICVLCARFRGMSRTEAARRASLVTRRNRKLERLAAELERFGYTVHEASVGCHEPRPAGWHARGCLGAFGKPCTCSDEGEHEQPTT